jgi:hypothetical protein
VVACQYLGVKGVYKYPQMTEVHEDLQVRNTCKCRPLTCSYMYS